MARHGTIRELAILDGDCSSGRAAVIDELAERYDVPVFVYPQTVVPS